MSECLFCRIVSRELPAQLVHEDEFAVAFKDIAPKAPVHVLVVPKKHLARLSDSSDGDAALLGHLQRVAARIAAQYKLESFRVVTNNGRDVGQTVDHLHYHVVGGGSIKSFD
jgi:histidine triad (HIT) family protein